MSVQASIRYDLTVLVLVARSNPVRHYLHHGQNLHYYLPPPHRRRPNSRHHPLCCHGPVNHHRPAILLLRHLSMRPRQSLLESQDYAGELHQCQHPDHHRLRL